MENNEVVRPEGRSFSKARAYAFLLLKYRQRSEKEIRERLSRKKFPEETIKDTIAFLKEKKFIDDNLFARAWLSERLQKAVGPRRLIQELKHKGIEQKVIEDNLNEVKGSYNELEIVRELAAGKLKRFKNLDFQTAKRRVYGYLLRRGYSPEIVMDVLNQFS